MSHLRNNLGPVVVEDVSYDKEPADLNNSWRDRREST